MSIVQKNLADKIDALDYSPSEMKKRRPSGKKVYKPQLSTKVRWGLEDLMERTVAAQRRMGRILDRLEAIRAAPQVDRELMLLIGKLEHELFGLALDVSEMERITKCTVQESKPAKDKMPAKV